MTDSSEVERSIILAADIKHDNPAEYYKVIDAISSGGFARVFRCMRIRDGQMFALRF